MKKYYKIYKQFEEFSKLISDINLQDESDYSDNDRILNHEIKERSAKL